MVYAVIRGTLLAFNGVLYILGPYVGMQDLERLDKDSSMLIAKLVRGSDWLRSVLVAKTCWLLYS